MKQVLTHTIEATNSHFLTRIFSFESPSSKDVKLYYASK